MHIFSSRYLIIIAIIFNACSTPTGDLPSFNLLLVDSTTLFNTSRIPRGKPTIFIFLSPDCEHCQNETARLLSNMDSLKNVQFYILTTDPFERLKVYNKYYKIYNYPNIVLGRDYGFFFPEYFKSGGPPYLVIYDKNKRKRAIFKGEANISQVISVINKL